MDQVTAKHLASYEEWANERALRAIRDAAADPRGPDVTTECVRWLSHIQAAREVWFCRIHGQPLDDVVVWPDEELEQAEERMVRMNAAFEGWLDGAPDLTRIVEYRNTQGHAFANTVADMLRHLLAHGGYHRGQIAAKLRHAGFAPLPTDFIMFVREGED